MWIHIFGRHIDKLGRLSSGIVTGWCGWCSGQRWHSGQRWRVGQRWRLGQSWGRLLCRLFGSLGWRCTCIFMSPACLKILCSAILVRNTDVCLILTKHRWVSSYCRRHLFIPGKLNTLHICILDFSARFLEQILCFLNCGAQKPSFGHFGHI